MNMHLSKEFIQISIHTQKSSQHQQPMGEMQIAVLMRQDRLPSSRTALITDDREVLVGCGGVESAGKARVLQKVEYKVVDGPRARCIYSGKMRPCVHTKL